MKATTHDAGVPPILSRVMRERDALTREVELLRHAADAEAEAGDEARAQAKRLRAERDAARNGRQGADAAVRVLEAKGDRLRTALGKLDWLTSSPGDMRSEEMRDEARRIIRAALDEGDADER